MDIKIYLSGGMSNLSLEEQTKWRDRVQKAITIDRSRLNYNPIFFSPPDYFNFEQEAYKSEREVFEYDLMKLRNSDLVIVNFNAPNSIGTAMELAIAKEYRIPVIGLNKDNKELHSWLCECTTRMCSSMSELVDYVIEFYLI